MRHDNDLDDEYSMGNFDKTWKVTSLDSDYFFDVTNTQIENCIHEHHPLSNNEIELNIGDQVKLHFYVTTHANSQIQNYLFYGGKYKNATNLRTNKTGLYPAYKTFE